MDKELLRVALRVLTNSYHGIKNDPEDIRILREAAPVEWATLSIKELANKIVARETAGKKREE